MVLAAKQWLHAVEIRAIRAMRRVSAQFLRATLGIVFVWFGALKIADITPVADFVANTVPWLDPGWFVPALGLFEVTFGILLVTGRYLGPVCLLLISHLFGTFFALVMQPNVTFQDGNLMLLTFEGEFIVKNIVLIAALMVVAARYELDEREFEFQFRRFVSETQRRLLFVKSLPPLERNDDLFK